MKSIEVLLLVSKYDNVIWTKWRQNIPILEGENKNEKNPTMTLNFILSKIYGKVRYQMVIILPISPSRVIPVVNSIF